jgi:NADPH:quinone reductase-like Zn-dependent oxidoreductase
MFVSRHREADLETLRQLAAASQLTPAVSTTYPLADVPRAIRDLQGGHARGKIAITI